MAVNSRDIKLKVKFQNTKSGFKSSAYQNTNTESTIPRTNDDPQHDYEELDFSICNLDKSTHKPNNYSAGDGSNKVVSSTCKYNDNVKKTNNDSIQLPQTIRPQDSGICKWKILSLVMILICCVELVTIVTILSVWLIPQKGKDINSVCSNTNECQKTLSCINGQCQCDTWQFWTNSTCTRRKDINSVCSNTNECQKTLSCINGQCQCDNWQFWTNSTCTRRKDINSVCSNTNECQKTLSCSNGQCQCNTLQFWTNSTCARKKPMHSVCSNTNECQKTLSCINGQCQCDTRQFWTNSTCERTLPKECSDFTLDEDGVYVIFPDKAVSVVCMMRGIERWTVIQRRLNGSVDFYRTWSEYKSGFGTVNGEYWLGNDNIHAITATGPHQLSVYLEDWEGNHWYANYTTFEIGDEDSKYKLTVSGYSGTAGDSMRYHSGHKFSTYNQDNDIYGGNCATLYHGAWWYKNCFHVNLNGRYNGTGYTGVIWAGVKNGYSMKTALIAIRRR